MISPRDLAATLGETSQSPRMELSPAPFHAVVIDSRKVEPGDLFIALRGEHTDGHKFLGDAIARGATGLLTRLLPPDLPEGVAAFVVDDPLQALQRAATCWRRSMHVRVVGITGSVGKTTTREAITQLLRGSYATFESPRNFNSEIGLPLALLELGPEHDWAVLELGPYDLNEIRLLCKIAGPEIGVVTNVGPTHLERFGSLDAIEEAKGMLPESLAADGLAVLNADDDRTMAMRQRTRARVLSFGLSPDADVRATNVESRGLEGLRFDLEVKGETVHVETALAGAHHVMTALAAAAVALGAGLSVAQIRDGLETLRPGSRLVVRRAFSGATILDDTYNAAPLSVRAALDLLAETPGRHIAVLGDMLELGNEEETAHREIGAYSVDRCDRLVAVGTRARGIADGAWDAGHQQIQWYEDKEAAAAALRQEIGADDVVLVKASHGMALESIVEGLVTA